MKKLFAVLVFALLTLGLDAQPSWLNDGLEAYAGKMYISDSGDTLRYRALSPENMKKGKKYPLVLFLHGSGERGSDNSSQLFHGGQMWLNPIHREKYPCYVIVPQCPVGERWSYHSKYSADDQKEGDSKNLAYLKAIIDSYIENEPVDTRRIYITGLSMGGLGTFDMCIQYPDLFAAAVPICGAVDVTKLPAAKKVHFKIYHGDRDDSVPLSGSRAAYRTLKEIGADVTYVEVPAYAHNVWDYAFRDPEYLGWMFKQKKSTR